MTEMRTPTSDEADREALLREIVCADPARRACLEAVRELGLPDAWIGAGFVRNAVWDALTGMTGAHADADLDVIWFDPARIDPAFDREAEHTLSTALPGRRWSVKNQARMHLRNGDPPYASAADALRFWPETATAVAVRLDAHGELAIAAPWGLADLFSQIIRPTPAFAARKHALFLERVREKRWLERWPGVTVQTAGPT